MAKIKIENLIFCHDIQQLNRDEQSIIHGGTTLCFEPGEPFPLPGGGVGIPLILFPCPHNPSPYPYPLL